MNIFSFHLTEDELTANSRLFSILTICIFECSWHLLVCKPLFVVIIICGFQYLNCNVTLSGVAKQTLLILKQTFSCFVYVSQLQMVAAARNVDNTLDLTKNAVSVLVYYFLITIHCHSYAGKAITFSTTVGFNRLLIFKTAQSILSV